MRCSKVRDPVEEGDESEDDDSASEEDPALAMQMGPKPGQARTSTVPDAVAVVLWVFRMVCWKLRLVLGYTLISVWSVGGRRARGRSEGNGEDLDDAGSSPLPSPKWCSLLRAAISGVYASLPHISPLIPAACFDNIRVHAKMLGEVCCPRTSTLS